MRGVLTLIKNNKRVCAWLFLAVLAMTALLIYKLGSLVGGMSEGELATASAAVGWHGIYHDPFYLPLKLVRSAVFYLSPDHGQTLTRLPNAIFGFFSVASFALLIRLWHGTRTAIFTTFIFATSAWLLHASRLASLDVVYLWAAPTLLLIHLIFQKHADKRIFVKLGFLGYLSMLYIPGLVWFIFASLIINKKQLVQAWGGLKLVPDKLLAFVLFVAALPLLIVDFTRKDQLVTWLGLPTHFGSVGDTLKDFVAVPVHLFIRGPQYPDIWLARAPVLDIFALFASLIGVYFYATHRDAARSKLLVTYFVLAFLLVGIGGPVTLSFLVPILYVLSAMGIAYLLHDWLKVFPNNPFARTLGVGLIVIAVALSCLYNLRSYYIAWPHNPTTQVIFQYHR